MPAITQRPPSLSVRIPIGSRMTEPTKTGIPNKTPICTAFQANILFSTKKVTNTPLIIQAAKHTANAIVLRNNIRWEVVVLCASIVILLKYSWPYIHGHKKTFVHLSPVGSKQQP